MHECGSNPQTYSTIWASVCNLFSPHAPIYNQSPRFQRKLLPLAVLPSQPTTLQAKAGAGRSGSQTCEVSAAFGHAGHRWHGPNAKYRAVRRLPMRPTSAAPSPAQYGRGLAALAAGAAEPHEPAEKSHDSSSDLSPTSAASTHRRCGPARTSFRYRARVRLRAAANAILLGRAGKWRAVTAQVCAALANLPWKLSTLVRTLLRTHWRWSFKRKMTELLSAFEHLHHLRGHAHGRGALLQCDACLAADPGGTALYWPWQNAASPLQ